MSGSTPPWFIQQFFDASGKPLSGGKVYFWVAGSTVIPKAVYADIGLTTPLSQPVVLDAGGFAPQYFMESGLYKIQTFDQFHSPSSPGGSMQTADNIQGAVSAGGGSSTLFQDSPTIHWSVVNIGGVNYEVGTVQADQVGDHKVLGDGLAGDVAGYLIAKLVDAAGNPLSVNGSHQLILPFARLDGSAFTGSVSIAGQLSSQGDTALATGPGATVHLVGPATIEQAIANILKLPGVTAGQWLMVNGSGQVVGVAAPTSDHMVLYDVSDAIPGFLGVKVQAGSGIQITLTTDGVVGKVMHFNVNPAIFSRPANQVIIGNGSGLTSSDQLTATGGDLQAGSTVRVGPVPTLIAPNTSTPIVAVGDASVSGNGNAFLAAQSNTVGAEAGVVFATPSNGNGQWLIYKRDDGAGAYAPIGSIVFVDGSIATSYEAFPITIEQGTGKAITLNRPLLYGASGAGSIPILFGTTVNAPAPASGKMLLVQGYPGAAGSTFLKIPTGATWSIKYRDTSGNETVAVATNTIEFAGKTGWLTGGIDGNWHLNHV